MQIFSELHIITFLKVRKCPKQQIPVHLINFRFCWRSEYSRNTKNVHLVNFRCWGPTLFRLVCWLVQNLSRMVRDGLRTIPNPLKLEKYVYTSFVVYRFLRLLAIKLAIVLPIGLPIEICYYFLLPKKRSPVSTQEISFAHTRDLLCLHNRSLVCI